MKSPTDGIEDKTGFATIKLDDAQAKNEELWNLIDIVDDKNSKQSIFILVISLIIEPQMKALLIHFMILSTKL